MNHSVHPETAIVTALRTSWLSFHMHICCCAKWKPRCFKMFQCHQFLKTWFFLWLCTIPFPHCNYLVPSATCTHCPQAARLRAFGRARHGLWASPPLSDGHCSRGAADAADADSRRGWRSVQFTGHLLYFCMQEPWLLRTQRERTQNGVREIEDIARMVLNTAGVIIPIL